MCTHFVARAHRCVWRRQRQRAIPSWPTWLYAQPSPPLSLDEKRRTAQHLARDVRMALRSWDGRRCFVYFYFRLSNKLASHLADSEHEARSLRQIVCTV